MRLHHTITIHLQTRSITASPHTAVLHPLKEALCSVPQTLHVNAYHYNKPRWLTTLADMRTAIRNGRMVGVNATEGTVCTPSQCLPFNSNRLLVNNVLQTLQQLLKLDITL